MPAQYPPLTDSQPHKMTDLNQQWIYRERPVDRVGPEHYELMTQPVAAPLDRGEVLVRGRWFSVDPYMRIQQAARDTWEAPHPLDTVQGGGVVGQVVDTGVGAESLQDAWVWAYTGWQEVARTPVSAVQVLDVDGIPPQAYLGALGMPGRTAWFGLMEAGRPRPGETLVVSGAAGAVGSLVVQFGKRAGLRVVGVAGGPDKCRFVTDTLGADACIDYRTLENWQAVSERIADVAGPVDVYYDNVGGRVSDGVIPQLNLRGRVVICGQISQYDGGLDQPQAGPRFLQHLLFKRATIQGILARDFSHRNDEFLAAVKPWVRDGSLHFEQTVIDGFDRLPEALGMLFEGRNRGKLLVRATG